MRYSEYKVYNKSSSQRPRDGKSGIEKRQEDIALGGRPGRRAISLPSYGPGHGSVIYRG